MPLSEHEQRILRQIEQELERDPSFAHQGYRLPRRRVVLFAVLTVAALVGTVLALGISVWVAVAGFVVTLVLAANLEYEVRLVTRHRIDALPLSVWLGARSRRSGDGRRPPRRGRTSIDE